MRPFFLLLFFTAASLAAGYPGSPASVVAAYIEADSNGLALDGQTAPQLLNFTTWPEAPGWDSFVVIKSYEIGEVGWTGNQANVQITYQTLGPLSALEFTSRPASEVVDFDLEKKNDRWKIEKPQLPPHLSVSSAIAALKALGAEKNAAGKASLKKLQALE